MLALPSRLSLLLLCLPFSLFANNTLLNTSPENTQTLIPAFTANYTLLHKGDPVGSAIRELSYLNHNQAIYHYETEVEWLVFSDNRSETSKISLKNQQVTPQHYVYIREGTGRDKSYEWSYNLAEKTAKDIKKNRQITLYATEGLQDKLSYHLQHRLNLIKNPKQKRFVYSVISTSGTIKDYAYQYDGEEELMLPYGLVKTIRLKREIVEKKRVTYAWFAPELNYLLVKLYQIKSGAEQFEAQLSRLETK